MLELLIALNIIFCLLTGICVCMLIFLIFKRERRKKEPASDAERQEELSKQELSEKRIDEEMRNMMNYFGKPKGG